MPTTKQTKQTTPAKSAKRNPTDTTLRNTQAANKKLARLHVELTLLKASVKELTRCEKAGARANLFIIKELAKLREEFAQLAEEHDKLVITQRKGGQ